MPSRSKSEMSAASLLAAIVDSADDAIVSKDLEGVITSWNRAAERIFGYSEEEVIGRPITILIPADRIHEETEILRRIGRGERVEHFNTVRRKKNGERIDVSVTVSPVRDRSGALIGASKIARDITEHRRDLERLAAAEERFRVTLESIGDGVIATDLQSRVTFMNKVAEELTGWPEPDAMNKPLNVVFNIVSEMSRRPAANPVARVLREGTVVGLANHTALIARDGRERSIADSAAPIVAGGHLAGVVLVFRDVTEDRAAELAIARLASIVENSDDAIVGKDLHGVITSWNRGAERIFWYTAEEAIGKLVTILIPPERQDEEQDILSRLRKGERVNHFETERITKAGHRVKLSVNISPIRDNSGDIVGASKIARLIGRET